MTLSIQHRKERGISLVEALIVLSIFAILVAAIWATASTAFNNQKKRQLSEQVIQIVNNIKGLYQGQQPSIGFTTIPAANAGVFPADMVISKTLPDIRHPYATSHAVDITNDNPGKMILQLGNSATTGLPQDACVEVLSRLAGTQEGANRIGLTAVSVAGTAIAGFPASPISPATAATACNATGNGNYVFITFAVP